MVLQRHLDASRERPPRGLVEDVSDARHELIQQRPVEDRPLNERQPPPGPPTKGIPVGQFASRQIVEYNHPRPKVDKGPGQMRTNTSGPFYDEAPRRGDVVTVEAALVR